MDRILIAAAVSLVATIALIVRWRARYGPMRLGDFVKVKIPRTLDGPLSMGTRMDLAAALNKAGVAREEVRTLIDGDHDRELLARYWALQDPPG